MSDLQHRGARQLLDTIVSYSENDSPLTYKRAAMLLGRDPKTNSRAVAQMCDLLDAAAAMAHVPLLALVKVMTNKEEINPKAFRQNKELRQAILLRSRKYKFTSTDFEAIRQSLDCLLGMGNRAAWAYVNEEFPAGSWFDCDPLSNSFGINDAINDLGSDAPTRIQNSGLTYARNFKIRAAVKKRARGRCEYCGELGFMGSNNKRYLECHHIIALAKDGEDRMTNVIALCPGHHREAHFGANASELEMDMIEKVRIFQRIRNR